MCVHVCPCVYVWVYKNTCACIRAILSQRVCAFRVAVDVSVCVRMYMCMCVECLGMYPNVCVYVSVHL